MHIILERPVFLKALAHQQGVIEKRTTVPVLSHVLLEAKAGGDSVALVGTDLELTLVENVAAQVKSPGEITLSIQLLFDIVRRLQDDAPIEIQLESDQVVLKNGPSQFKLQTLSPSSFPDLSALGDFSDPLTFKTEDLRRLIDQTRFAMSSEVTRFSLNGIYFHCLNGDFRAVATDAHRLALSQIKAPEGQQDFPGVILSKKTVNELRKLLDEGQEEIAVAFTSNQVCFSLEGLKLYSRLVQGQFPDYTRAIPQNNQHVASVEATVFERAVGRVSMVSNEKNRVVRIEIDADKIKLSAHSPEHGFAHEEIPAKYQGPMIDMGLNARYILDVLQQVRGTNLKIALENASIPTVLGDPQNDQALYVLMPMRA